MDAIKAIIIVILIILGLVFFEAIIGLLGYVLLFVICLGSLPGVIIGIYFIVQAIATDNVPQALFALLIIGLFLPFLILAIMELKDWIENIIDWIKNW